MSEPTAVESPARTSATTLSHEERLARVPRGTDFPFTYAVINPLNRVLLRPLFRAGITPNHLTLLSLLFTVLTGVSLALRVSGGWGWGVLAVVAGFVSHQLDALDGDLARYGLMESDFGGVFDSVCDRFREMWWVVAIAWGGGWAPELVVPAVICLCCVQLYFYANDVPIRVAERIEDRQAPRRWKFTLGPYGDNPTRIKLGLFEPFLYALPMGVAVGQPTLTLWACGLVFGAALVWKLLRIRSRE